MKLDVRKIAILVALLAVVGLPLAIYGVDNVARRNLFKEILSILTILSMTVLLGQLFLARSNTQLLTIFKAPEIQKVHKVLAYSAVGIMVVHPFLIVLPRFFEGGVSPFHAFWIMVTDFQSLGIVLGLLAWTIMVTLGITAYLRMSLMKRFANRYRGWRYFHGGLAVAFVVFGLWHAIDLGRHTDWVLSLYLLALAGVGLAMLGRLYWPVLPKPNIMHALSEGVKG